MRSSKRQIIYGFSFVLLLSVLVISIAVNSIKDNSATIADIVVEHSEIADIFVMRGVAQRRALVLYQMAATKDRFEQDELFMEFNSLAADFVIARDSLLDKLHSKGEKEAWDSIQPGIASGQEIQTEIADLVFNDNLTLAHEKLTTTMSENQASIMSGLTRIHDEQYRLIRNDLLMAERVNRNSFILILVFGLSGLILGVFVMMYVYRHNSKTEEAYATQKALAESSNKAKSEFLANMSHEIRTPLTAIIGFAHTLVGDEIDLKEIKKLSSTILKNGEHLHQIINNILDISKIEAAQLDIEILQISPIQLVSEVESIIGLSANNKGLKFDVTFNFPLPSTINSDPTRIRQILLNLCGNAVKFTDAGHVKLSVSFSQDDNNIYFIVEDTGVGIPDDALSTIFSPFSQADTSTTRKYGGSGLGLAISSQLASKMGGQLQCKSERDKGSIFTLSLPLDDSQEVKLISSIDEYHVEESDVGHEKIIIPNLTGHVLLAEDSVDNQDLISMYLKKAGVVTTIANNGKEAVEKCLVEDFDLVLMDMQMPIMGGLEATTLLRSAGFDNPIIALTANAIKTEKQKCFEAGVNDYLTKPIVLPRFYSTIAKHLQNVEEDKNMTANVIEMRDDPEYLQLVDNFSRSLPVLVNELATAIRKNEWKLVESVSHKLKGMSGSFGYQKISKICEELNLIANSHVDENIEEKATRLISEISLLLANKKVG